jgi:hypothetical protein
MELPAGKGAARKEPRKTRRRGQVMSKDCDQHEDDRAAWERPVVRRLDTKYAEGPGPFQDEGQSSNCLTSTKFLSCKNTPH